MVTHINPGPFVNPWTLAYFHYDHDQEGFIDSDYILRWYMNTIGDLIAIHIGDKMRTIVDYNGSFLLQD